MRTDLVQHLLNYDSIYEYVSVEKKNVADIKEYLMQEKEVSETSARRYIKLITSDNPGLFIEDNNMISIDGALAKEVIKEISTLLGVKVDDMSEETISKKNDVIDGLKKQIDELNVEKQSIIKELENEKENSGNKDLIIEDQNLIIQQQDEKYKNLVKKQIKNQLNRDVVFAGKIEMLPKPTLEEELFVEDSILQCKLEKSVSKNGGSRSSFYSVEEDEKISTDQKENPQIGHELNSKNYFTRIARSIMTNSFFERWAKDISEEKDFQKKHGIEPKISKAKLQAKEKADEDKTEIEKHGEELIRKRAISVQALLNDERLTDQMRLQLYARFCQYRGTEMEPLINFAADYGINSKWFIQVLENPESCDNYENIRDYLRIFAKPSEYRMRLDFARELLDGVWNIKLDYDGIPTLFALVPVKEINEIREMLLLPNSEFTCKDFVFDDSIKNESVAAVLDISEKSEKMRTKQDKGLLVEKPDHVKTFVIQEGQSDSENLGLDEESTEYKDFHESDQEE